jgi:hypothetical protein
MAQAMTWMCVEHEESYVSCTLRKPDRDIVQIGQNKPSTRIQLYRFLDDWNITRSVAASYRLIPFASCPMHNAAPT